MTFYTEGNVADSNITGTAFVPLERLAGIVGAGPNTNQLVKAMGKSRILGRVPALSQNAETDTTKDAFGKGPALLCYDKNSDFYGVWLLNATGKKNILAWADHPEKGAAPYGYYIHAYIDVPNAQQSVDLGFTGWDGQTQQMLKDYQPELWLEIKRLLGYPDEAKAKEPTAPERKLPPSPTKSGGGEASKEQTKDREFTVYEDEDGILSFWVAKDPFESAGGKKGNPHKGVSAMNPDDVGIAFPTGQRPIEIMGLEEYADKGWKGLDRRIVAWDESEGIHPASEELSSAMDAAEEGDKGAAMALAYIGVRMPQGQAQQGGILSRILR